MAAINPKAEKIIEDGWYPATIGETKMQDTKFGEKVLVPFDVMDGDGEIVDITAFLTLSDHPKSNVVKWGKSLFGDRPFDTDEFDGVKCEVFVEEGEDNEGQAKNFIRKVRIPSAKKSAAKEDAEADFDQIKL